MKNKFWTSWFNSFRKSDNKIIKEEDAKYVSKEEMKVLYKSWNEQYNIYDKIKKDRDKWKILFYEKNCDECFKYKEKYDKMKKHRDEWKVYALTLQKHIDKDSNNSYIMNVEYKEKCDNMEKDRDKWLHFANEYRELCYDYRNERSHYRIYI